jgi:hypothetical protein
MLSPELQAAVAIGCRVTYVEMPMVDATTLR